MRHTATIIVANNYLRIKDYHPEFIQRVINPFCRKYLCKTGREPIPGTQKARVVITHIFARFNNDKTELRITRGLLDMFVNFAKYAGYNDARFDMQTEDEITPVKVNFEWAEGWGEPRVIESNGVTIDQGEWCNYQLDDGSLKVNNNLPGVGKTVMATHTMVNMGVRTLITVLPKYISVWVTSFAKSLKLDPDDLVICDHGKLEEVADNIENGSISPKIIIMPLTRYDSYLKRERLELLPSLDDQLKKMGIGLRITDEAHESIYQIYMSMLFGNFKKTLALSATLKADDALTNDVYRWIYPKSCRFKEPEKPKYVKIVAYHHNMDIYKYRLRTQGFGGYSHINFENSIRRSSKVLAHYYELVKDAFDTFYMNGYRDGQKCLLFFATVEMCRKIAEFLGMSYPDLDIIKFTAEESKEDPDMYAKHQVVVTTPKSCGTGKDLEKLVTVISPYCVSSMQLNEQMKGRLRDISQWWADVDPTYVYFVCDDIPKQREYHFKRREVFESGSKSMHNWSSNKFLR